MRRHWAYLKYVLRHKWFVFQACLKLKVPLWSALIHDWDKFKPSSWRAYAQTFYDDQGKAQYLETWWFVHAWNFHQKVNKHHWQHWILYWDRGEQMLLEIPDRHLREMLADWIGAGQASKGIFSDTRKWYAENRHKMLLHDKSKAKLEKLMDEIGM